MLRSQITPGKIYGPTLYKGRRFVTIERPDGSKCSMTYARFLMQEHLGRTLGPDERVHHIDEDPLNDVVSNYKIESSSDHARLHRGVAEKIVLDCPECGVTFSRSARHVRHNKKQGKAGPFCGKSCAGKYSARVPQ